MGDGEGWADGPLEPTTAPAVDLLARRVAKTPETTALVDPHSGQSWTYRDLDRWVDAVAARVLANSADSDSATARRVGLLLPPRPAAVVTAYAAMRLGCPIVGLNTELPASTLRDQLCRTDPELLVCGAESFETAESAASCPVVSVDSDADWPAEPTGESEATVDPVPVAPDETALILCTSGTTGQPRAVRLTRENLEASARASAARLGVGPEDRWLGCLPVYHMGGFAPLIRAVRDGATLLFQREFDAEATARILAEREVTHVSFVPTQLKRLLAVMDETSTFPALRVILLGGAPAGETLLERAWEHDLPVHPTYGLTETASQVATARPAEARANPGTVGRPLPGTTVHVIEDGQAVSPGERGELVVEGPTVTPGYLDEDATAAVIGEDGLHTGDIGYRDEAGRLWVVGRRDEAILTGGELVVPGEVSRVLESHPAVERAAVVGLDDAEWGERVVALVVADGDAPDREKLRAFCADSLPGYAVPKDVTFTDSLPRTASGTVDRAAVRSRLQD